VVEGGGGVFNRIFAGPSAEGGAPDQLTADATHLKAHRTVASLRKKGLCGSMIHQIIVWSALLRAVLVARRVEQQQGSGHAARIVGRAAEGGLNSKLHTICDEQGRPRVLLLTEGQVSDYKGAATMLPDMPSAPVLIADRGYDADWFRQALRDRGTRPLHPGPLTPSPPWQAALPTSPQDRDHARQA
jgi:IS5 family transposase